MTSRILLVDDHQMVRQGLRLLMKSQTPDAEVTEAQDGFSAVRLANEISPDVVVMDLMMPGLNGIDATRQILSRNPGVKVMVLSARDDDSAVDEALDAGAVGFIRKDAAFEELCTAIRTIKDDQIYLSPRLRSSVLGRASGMPAGKTDTAEGLSAREREVLKLMAQGRATKEIAADLKLSIKTVETHRRRIMEKLNLYSVAELTKYAIRHGLSSLDN
jgi:two-component system response regulator NreC